MATFEQDELHRAAGALHRDAAAREVLRRLEERWTDTWKRSDPSDDVEREAAWHMVRAVIDLRAELAALAAEPTVARFNRRLQRGT